MKSKQNVIVCMLAAAAFISVAVPFLLLFTGEETLAWNLRQVKSHVMLGEITVLFLALFFTFLYIQKPMIRAGVTAGICLAFCWIHVTFLPMLVSGLYVGYLLLVGRFIRMKTGNISLPHCHLADFLLGASLVISEFCLLSALGVGEIPVLKAVTAAQGTLLYSQLAYGVIKSTAKGTFFRRLAFVYAGTECRKQKTDERVRDEKSSDTTTCTTTFTPTFTNTFTAAFNRPVLSALFALMIVMVLIQIGKMNITLDFDTLWYGVRSEYILNNGKGIYENPGLVSMAYVYSKGLEVLLLPISDLASHSYLLFFNVWAAGLGLGAAYGIARFYMGKSCSLLSAALMSATPGIMNMSISAKPDIITWLLQLIMIFYFLCYVESSKSVKDRKPLFLILAAGAYLLSLTMKPTALVFSTAVFGMAGLYIIFTRKLSFKAPIRQWFLLMPEAAALVGIWARTMILTGMPVTSVFTSIFAKLGFQIKYPFATGALPQNYQEESVIFVLLRRLARMLLAPTGKDMGHVVIAWGSSLFFFFLVCFILFQLGGALTKKMRTPHLNFAHVVFWPFLAVNMVSLTMLYQVDGNYFILLYTALIFFFSGMLERLADGGLRKKALGCLLPILVFCTLVSAETNWAWQLGFSDIQLLNKGRVNHRAMQHEDMIKKGNAEIWNILEQDKRNRVIAFGTHPFCLEFPCNVQSYKDITAPWGNVELVNSTDAFKDYMAYAGTDYVYAEAGYVGENSWSWSYDLLKSLIADGSLTGLFFENGNMLARVSEHVRTESGQDAPGAAGITQDEPESLSFEPVDPESGKNLRMFMENYKTAG